MAPSYNQLPRLTFVASAYPPRKDVKVSSMRFPRKMSTFVNIFPPGGMSPHAHGVSVLAWGLRAFVTVMGLPQQDPIQLGSTQTT
jgi:hypothetical protein